MRLIYIWAFSIFTSDPHNPYVDMECWKFGAYAWVMALSPALRKGGKHDILLTIEKLCVLRTQLEDLLTRSNNDIEKNRSIIRAARARGETTRSQLIVKLLKRSLVLKQERISISNKMATVEMQISALESSDFNSNMLTTMQKSADTMRKMGLEKGLQQADTTISELEENLHVAGEIQDALCVPGAEVYLNDDELDAELDEIMGGHENPHTHTRSKVASITVPPFAINSSMNTVEHTETASITPRTDQSMQAEAVPL
jgi:hypothetical protein